MDYKKVNSITTDGQGNIVLQDIHKSKVTINVNNKEEIEEIVQKVGYDLLLRIEEIYRTQSDSHAYTLDFLEKELIQRKKYSKFKSVVIFCFFAVICILVFVLFRYYTSPFGFTVSVFGKNSTNNIALLRDGIVSIELGSKREELKLNEKGQVDFKNIPFQFRNEYSKITIIHNIFQSAYPDSLYLLTPNQNITIELEYKGLDKIWGIVKDEENIPLENVNVSLKDLNTITDENGRFVIFIPKDKQEKEQKITAFRKGFILWDYTVPVDAKVEMGIILKK